MECAIPMCGVESGEEGSDLVPFCPNGHKLHSYCLGRICESCFPSGTLCPQCRDGSVNFVVTTVALSAVDLMHCPVSFAGVAKAAL